MLTTISHAAQTAFAVVNGGIDLLSSHWLMAIVWSVVALLVLLDPAMWRLAPAAANAGTPRRPGLLRVGRGNRIED